MHFMFCSRVGFSGTADLMALFSIRTNSKWRPPPSWIISNGHISATAHDLLIWRASHGHLCDSTAFLFTMATKVDLSHFSLAQLKRLTLKTPHRERIAYILSPFQVVLWPILCFNLSLFVTVSTRVGLAKDK